ncbi:hypothetical protein B4V02_18965 [Paenibacillus kribbensis]|uniref:Uncharacterized protein n=1 Tax=Paenibacillus kribbensis TaxID=172713 RepID=A0A222WSA5_9BACL|nr:hypothetical protein [Paenibacillus kribbensis]ASR48621.1 hypothetical protein B4V02_18965 [Paenibacillus kribbensis]
MNPELHLFIIWEHATYCAQQIIEDLKVKFTIKRVYQIYWNNSNFSKNLSRLYGQSLPPGCEKQIHCGMGPFILVIVQDENPVYAIRSTSKGMCNVNINTFDAKSLYRTWTGGGHRIHGTNTQIECDHDLTLFISCNAKTFLSYFPGNWDGVIHPLYQDLLGTNGWQDIQQLFTVLNWTTEYVVLRNFECLPNQYHLELHGDIDLLVKDAVEVSFITNATKVFLEEYRVHYQINIAGKTVLFDFRYIGDNYYCNDWEMSILRNKELSHKGFFIPNQEDYFFSLIYHAFIHKPTIAQDYIERLIAMANQLNIEHFSYQTLTNNKELKLFLDAYMSKKGYHYSVPNDLSVFFNSAVLGGG